MEFVFHTPHRSLKSWNMILSSEKEYTKFNFKFDTFVRSRKQFNAQDKLLDCRRPEVDRELTFVGSKSGSSE